MADNMNAWLEGLGLGKYAAVFVENEIDLATAAHLDDADLRELGLPLGPRKKLSLAIEALRAAPEPATGKPSVSAPANAERRQLTVMFCDLVGSTALSGRLDPEDMREVLRRYQDAVAGVVSRNDGYVANYLGDGVLAYFGWPKAHEDQAAQAVRAALAAVRAVADIEASGGEPLAARAGIASGQVVVGDLEGEIARQAGAVSGETPNLAARLQALAGSGEVVIDGQTRDLVGRQFDLADLGPDNLKGIAEPVPTWRVCGEAAIDSRFEVHAGHLVSFVGREHELGLLLERWRLAQQTEGQVVLLSGEAGIGKSRLTEELRRRVGREDAVRLSYQCAPQYANSAFWPVIRQLQRAADFGSDDTPDARLDKLEALVGGDRDVAQLLGALLSLPVETRYGAVNLAPEASKRRTIQVLVDQLLALSAERPVLFLFEDAHWIDPSSEELLVETVACIVEAPVLMVVTARPEWRASWDGLAHASTLNLSRLARGQAAEIVAAIAGPQVGPEATERIVARTDGIPLFVEELTKALVERGLDATDADIPATLQASLAARLDRLDSAVREIAQIGAVIGREFDHDLLAAVADRPATVLDTTLEQLLQSQLVLRAGAADRYSFKHALVQDAAYGSLLRSMRQALHARIAAAMQERSGGEIEVVPEIIARHLSEAGEHDQAAAYWLEAGRRAGGRSANQEAAAHLARGISGLQGLAETPERARQELALRLALGPLLLSNRGYRSPECRDAYQRAAELARRIGDDRGQFAASWGLWITTRSSGVRGDEIRLQHLDDMEGIAERLGDPELSLQAHHSSWATRMWLGEFARSQDHISQGLILYDRNKHRHHALTYGGHDPGVCGRGQGAIALWALGFLDQAEHSARDAIQLAETLGHVPSTLHALWFAGSLHCLRRDVAAARETGERMLALSVEHGLSQYKAIGRIIYGWAGSQDPDHKAGLADLRAAVDDYGAMAQVMSDLYRALLAEIELRAGNAEQARTALVRMESGSGWCRAELLRLRGNLLRSGPDRDIVTADELYREATSVARGQKARSLELRAAIDHARLWCEEGRHDRARDLLAPIYHWFTEGYDAPDLLAAKALLAELN